MPFLSALWFTSSHHKIKIFVFAVPVSFLSFWDKISLLTAQFSLALNLTHSPPWPLTSVFPVSDSHLLELQAGRHCAIQSKTFLMLILKEDSMISCPVNPFSENDISLILIISTSPNCLRMWVDLLFMCGTQEEKYYWGSLGFSDVNLKIFNSCKESTT